MDSETAPNADYEHTPGALPGEAGGPPWATLTETGGRLEAKLDAVIEALAQLAIVLDALGQMVAASHPRGAEDRLG